VDVDAPGRDEDEIARFRAAFERHYEAVLAYALRRIATPEDAEEVTASTFVTAWRRLERMPPEPDTRTWLYRVVWRTLANQRRAGDRQARLVERVGRMQVVPEMTSEVDADGEGLLLEALGRLREQDQEVLRLVAWEELSSVAHPMPSPCACTAPAPR
jgi:RNA polymerase sigma-70 factor (ECF subfamily)